MFPRGQARPWSRGGRGTAKVCGTLSLTAALGGPSLHTPWSLVPGRGPHAWPAPTAAWTPQKLKALLCQCLRQAPGGDRHQLACRCLEQPSYVSLRRGGQGIEVLPLLPAWAAGHLLTRGAGSPDHSHVSSAEPGLDRGSRSKDTTPDPRWKRAGAKGWPLRSAQPLHRSKPRTGSGRMAQPALDQGVPAAAGSREGQILPETLWGRGPAHPGQQLSLCRSLCVRPPCGIGASLGVWVGGQGWVSARAKAPW